MIIRLFLIGDTDFETFPPEFGNLTNLVNLTMNRVKVTEMNINFTKMTKLETITATSGMLKSFTEESGESVRYLAALKELSLASNRLEAIPHGFGFLSKLIKIDLNRNSIGKVPGDFYFLNKNVDLNLDNNSLFEPYHSWYTLDGVLVLLRNLRPYCTAYAENCVVEPECVASAPLNTPVELVVRAKDFHGDDRVTGKDPFELKVTCVEGPIKGDTIESYLRDNDGKKDKAGTYDCYFKATVPGKYQVEITVNGINIKGSPWIMNVEE